jgi:hypothetical protein
MMWEVDRRQMLAGLGATAAALWLPQAAAATGGFVMWRDPGCGCCLEWAKRVEAAFGRKLTILSSPDMAAVKRAQGVPSNLHSCHTALIQTYVVEGHVPPSDIKRVIAARSRTVKGLAVPGMPVGSPGMETGSGRRDPYKVFAFGPGRQPSVFSSYG